MWQITFGVCCFLLVLPLWLVDVLPLVDAPQHAAQLATGLHWPDKGFPYARYFEINWIANSLLPYAIGHLFGLWVPVIASLKLSLSLALIAFVLATCRLLRTTGGDQWWAFASFPVAYGFACSWGFLPFVMAAPLGLLLIDTALRFRERPTRGRTAALAALVFLLFGSHVLVLAYAGLASALIVWSSPSYRARILGLCVLASVLPLVAVWWAATIAFTPGSTAPADLPELWHGIARVPQLFGYMVGASTISYGHLLWAGSIITAPLLLGGRPTNVWWRFAPLSVALMFHFLLPSEALGTAHVYQRFTLFVIPAFLLALDARMPRAPFARTAAVALAVISLTFVASRFYAFAVESRDVIAVLEQLEPNKRLLALIDDPESRAFPWPAYVHAGSWYQASKGGVADFSFAEFFPNRFRYRAGMDPPLPHSLEWAPHTFVWEKHGGVLYDYFLVRGTSFDPFSGATTRIELVSRRGTWAAYSQERPLLSTDDERQRDTK